MKRVLRGSAQKLLSSCCRAFCQLIPRSRSCHLPNCLSVDAGEYGISVDPPLHDHIANPTSLALPDFQSQESRLLASLASWTLRTFLVGIDISTQSLYIAGIKAMLPPSHIYTNEARCGIVCFALRIDLLQHKYSLFLPAFTPLHLCFLFPFPFTHCLCEHWDDRIRNITWTSSNLFPKWLSTSPWRSLPTLAAGHVIPSCVSDDAVMVPFRRIRSVRPVQSTMKKQTTVLTQSLTLI